MSYPSVKLKEIALIKTGKLDSNAAVTDGVYPFFTCDPNTLRINNWAYDTEAVLLAGNNASGNYTAKYYKGKFNAYQRVYIIETADAECLNTRYLCYAMNQKLGLLKTMSSGSTTKFLTLGMLHGLNIPLPTIEVQDNIVTILSAYDNLIENNQKQIKLLEEAAQRLYKEWFVDLRFPGYEHTKIVDGVPEGWEDNCLAKIVEFKRGKTITKAQIESGTVPVVAGGLEPAYYHNIANTKAPVITVSASGANAGFTRMYYVDVFASDCSFVDRNACSVLSFVYCFLIKHKSELELLQKGSAQPHVYAKDINALHLYVPDVDLINKFCGFCDRLFLKIGLLEKQNESLIQARDRLLPKLMSGEVEV